MVLKYKLPAVLVLVLLSLSIIHFKNDIVLSNGDAYILNSYLGVIDGDSIKSIRKQSFAMCDIGITHWGSKKELD